MKWIPYAIAAVGGAIGAWLGWRKTAPKPGATPASADPIEDWAPQETTKAGECDPTEKPGVLAFRAWFKEKYGEHAGAPRNILRDCSVGSPTEHWEGRAWDWMIVDDATAKRAIDDLLANDGEIIRRAGIMYMIYNRRMWRAYSHGAETRTWAAYTGPNPHTDHIHFSFSKAGAKGETSFYRNLPVT